MDMDILNVNEKPIFDNSIVGYEMITYNPYVNSFDYGDEIRIPINQQDVNVLLCDSILFLNGSVFQAAVETKKLVTADTTVRPNFALFLFDKIRYEINGFEVDRCGNTGITSTLRNYLSFSRNESKSLQIAGCWTQLRESSVMSIVDYEYRFEVAILLKLIFGMMEDYKKIIMNAKHELILIRGRSDNNSFSRIPGGKDIKVKILKMQWKVPHITVNDSYKLKLLHFLEKSVWLSIAYRAWDLYEFLSLPKSSIHTWNVRTSNQLEKPRFVILPFQTNRKGVADRGNTVFDNCNLKTAKLYLNSVYFPHDKLVIDFKKGHYAQLYNMFSNFQSSYYGRRPDVLFNYSQFASVSPFVVFDTTKQNDTVKNNTTVDIRLEWKFNEKTPDKTSAFCLIIHDKLIEYNPFNNLRRELQ